MNTAYNPNDPAHLRERADALEAQMNGRSTQYLASSGEWHDRIGSQLTPFRPAFRYRPKPWTLPEPPAGMRWHRDDGWTEDMLPQGYRPLLLGNEDLGAYEESSDGRTWVNGRYPNTEVGPGKYQFYRTSRPLPSLMPGPEYHNPANLTLAQVGEGYRLLTKEEYEWCKNQNQVQAGVESWWNGEWDKTEWKGCNVSYTYRVPLNWQPSKPAPQPEPMLWDCAEDVIPGWIRSKSDFGRSYLILQICAEGIWTSNEAGNQLFTWGRIAAGDLQHSIDLRTWQPCRKSTEAQP